MKIYTTANVVVGTVLSATLFAGCGGSSSAPPETAAVPSAVAPSAVAPTVASESAHNAGAQNEVASNQNAQKVTVVVDGNGYTPSTLQVKAGQPVALTFDSKGESCGNIVVIPALNKTAKLKVGEQKTINFTPKAGQTVAFACSMKMFKGEISAR